MVRAFLHGISVATVLLFVLLTWSRDAAAGNLAGLIGQVERGIEEVEAPEEIQEEARRLLRKAGETAVSSTAVELIVRVASAWSASTFDEIPSETGLSQRTPRSRKSRIVLRSKG